MAPQDTIKGLRTALQREKIKNAGQTKQINQLTLELAHTRVALDRAQGHQPPCLCCRILARLGLARA